MNEEERSNLYIYKYSDLDDDFVFTETIYTLEYLHKLQRENQKLKGSLQTYEILLRVNVEENQKLKEQQKEFVKWLEEESKEVIRDAGYHQRICEDILEKYKKIVGDK